MFRWVNISTLLLVFIFTPILSAQAQNCSFMVPPKGWDCIDDPSQLPQKVKMIFIGASSGKTQFTPSINLACETTDLPQNEYVALAKQYHEGQGQTICTHIGHLNTDSGSVELLQIDRPSQWGDVRFIQAVLVEDAKAYVVTATCLKQDFSSLSSHIFKSIRSLNVSIDSGI